MKPVKVLHIITRLDRGGSSENTLLTLIELNRNKYTPSLLHGLTLFPDIKYFERAKEKTEEFVCMDELIREISPLNDISAFFKIYSFIKKGNYKIIHTHSSKAGILGRWAGWLAGVPIIIHTPHGHVFYGYYGTFISKCFVWAEKISALITDRIITLTERGKEEHVQFGVAEPEKFIPIHSGVDVYSIEKNSQDKDRASIRKKLIFPEEAVIAGSMGRLSMVKGYEYFIDAANILCKKYENIYFVAAGEGELRSSLERMINEYGIQDRFKLSGWNEDIAGFLNSIDIFVLSSLNEGMGKAIVEAMSAGLPSVGTDVGGISEIILEGETGFVVPAKNAKAIADRIEKLYLDPSLRDSMGKKGRKRAVLYDTHSMVKKIEGLYDKLLEEKGIK